MSKEQRITQVQPLQKLLSITSKTSMWVTQTQVSLLTILIGSLSIANITLHYVQLLRKTKLKGPFSFNNNKASDPYGFTMMFLKKIWHLLKNDILSVCSKFQYKAIINKNVNNTFITLIAKKACCLRPTNYKPISFTTSLYKIIAKTMAERLKCTLPDTISKSQLAFCERQANNRCYPHGQ